MNKIYQGKYLEVTFDAPKKRFIQFWKKSPVTIEDFKNEMLAYTKLYLENGPKQSMWLQENFSLPLDLEVQNWIEEFVNIPCKKAGNNKLAFIISENVLVHLQVIGAFEKIESCIIPHHFATREGAEKWLDYNELPSSNLLENLNIIYQGTNESGLSQLVIETKSGEVCDVIKLFDNLVEEANFIKANIQKFVSLTEREKEVLKHRSLGLQLSEIASIMNVSLFTAQTHWRNVKRKLNIHSVVDSGKYIKAFT